MCGYIRISTMDTLKRCSSCKSTILKKYFGVNRKGLSYKTCSTCRAGRKQHYLDNKEKNQQYRLDNKGKNKQYRLDNKEKIAERHRQYYLDNKEKIQQYQKGYREKMAGKHTAVADIKVYSLEQKTASVKGFINTLMDKKIVIDKLFEKEYIYVDDYLKINFTLLYNLYMSNGGLLMSKTEMRGHLNVLGYPKNYKTLCWAVGDLEQYTTRGYKLYKP